MVSSHDLQLALPPLLGLRWHNHGILRHWPRAPRTPPFLQVCLAVLLRRGEDPRAGPSSPGPSLRCPAAAHVSLPVSFSSVVSTLVVTFSSWLRFWWWWWCLFIYLFIFTSFKRTRSCLLEPGYELLDDPCTCFVSTRPSFTAHSRPSDCPRPCVMRGFPFTLGFLRPREEARISVVWSFCGGQPQARWQPHGAEVHLPAGPAVPSRHRPGCRAARPWTLRTPPWRGQPKGLLQEVGCEETCVFRLALLSPSCEGFPGVGWAWSTAELSRLLLELLCPCRVIVLGPVRGSRATREGSPVLPQVPRLQAAAVCPPVQVSRCSGVVPWVELFLEALGGVRPWAG